MQRISTATRVVDKFGAGKDGFTDGDVVGGIPATDLNAALFDNVQEEICNVIEGEGVALNPASRTQMRDVIRAMTETATVASDPTGADNSTKKASTGWIRNSMLAIATAAGFVISLSNVGYIKFPTWLGGLILQWGAGTVATAGSYTVVALPLAFPNSSWRVFASSNSTSGTPLLVGANFASLSAINIYASTSSAQCDFFAIGR